MKLKEKFKNFDAFFFDCDGVLWEENELLPGAKNLLQTLSDLHKTTCFLSNNSTKSLSQYVKKFSSLELPVYENQVMISSLVTLKYVLSKNYTTKVVYIIGEEGLKNTFESAGFQVALEDKEESNVAAVIVGMDRTFSYKKLSLGLKYCLKGADFIGTNPDPQFPTNNGFSPGAGSMIGALQAALGYPPEKVCGKPDPLMAELMIERFHLTSDKIVMIGDRVTTDLQFAINAKIKPILVKTGFGREEYSKHPKFSYFEIIESLEDLLE